MQALKEWRALLDREFGKNLAMNAQVTTNTFRGSDRRFSPGNVIDNDPETYWATDDEIHTGTLELDLGSSQEVKYIVLQEYIQLGQRVKAFEIELWDGKSWSKAADETTIGYKRILEIGPVMTEKIRVKIIDSKAAPVISNIEVY